MIKLSKFTHVLDNDKYKHIALFHAINLSTVFLERNALALLDSLKVGNNYDQLSSSEQQFIDELTQSGYVVDSNNLENDIIGNIRSQLKPKLSVLYLILTDKCNLGCKYCFIEAGFPTDYVCNSMTWDIAKKAIDLFINQKDKTAEGEILFYGGEPFLNPDLLFQCLEYLDRVEPTISRSIISNGTLITSDIAQRLSKYKRISISISLDGPESINDQMRIEKSGKGSFTKVMKGIRNLKTAGVDVGISCTIADHNVDNLPDILEWIYKEVDTNHLGVNFLVDTPRKFIEEDYIRKANNGLITFFNNNRDKEIYESRILRKLNAFIKSQPRVNDCAACGRQLVVSATGKLGICHEGLGESKTFVGSIDGDFNFYENDQVQEWAQRSPFLTEECLSCKALGMCGGGCPFGAMLRYGSIWDIDKRFCVHSKETLEWLIWGLYDKTISRIEAESLVKC